MAGRAAPWSRAAAKTASMIASPRHGRAASWIATNSQSRVDRLECPGDRIGALGPALDHLDIHEGDAGSIAALEQLAILGRDRQDHLADVVAVDERLDRVEPDGPSVQLGVDLLLLGVAESR